MASEKQCSNSCVNDPNFAIICSFFDRFASSCGISHPTFSELQEMIENSEDVPPELIDLHVKLLRKIRKSVTTEKWERVLIKFCHTYFCHEEGWELESGGYKKCKVPARLNILKTLLDAQFDLNSKLKNDVNKLTAEELRLEPLGRDKVGQSYWCQFDTAANVRVYREDHDEETWKLVAKDRESLVELITQLSSGEELLGLELLNEDSNSQEVENPITDTGQLETSTSEENTADVSSNDNIENCTKQDLILDDCVDNARGVDNESNDNSSISSQIKQNEGQDLVYSALESVPHLNIEKVSKDNGTESIENLPSESEQKSKQCNLNPSNFDSIKANSFLKIPFSKVEKTHQNGSPSPNNHNNLEPPNCDSLDVAEELKQRFQCRVNKTISTSKIDQLFLHKLASHTSDGMTHVTKPQHHSIEDKIELTQFRKLDEHSIEMDISSDSLGMINKNKRKQQVSESSVDIPSKKQFSPPESENIVGEEIEEPLMLIKGEGSGQDCDTGNPSRESDENIEKTEDPTTVDSNKIVAKIINEEEDQITSRNIASRSQAIDISRVCNDEKVHEIQTIVKDEDLVCNSDNSKERNMIISVCTLNGGNEFEGKTLDSKSRTVSSEHISNCDSVNKKSIEEQMSFITGESLSNEDSGVNDGKSKCEGYLENINKHLIGCNSNDEDKDGLTPEAKKTKVENDQRDIFGILDTNSNSSNDVINTLIDKNNDSTEVQSGSCKVKMDNKNKSFLSKKLNKSNKNQGCKKINSSIKNLDEESKQITTNSPTKTKLLKCQLLKESCNTDLNKNKSLDLSFSLEDKMCLNNVLANQNITNDTTSCNVNEESTAINKLASESEIVCQKGTKSIMENYCEKQTGKENNLEIADVKISGVKDPSFSDNDSKALNSDTNVKPASKKPKKSPKPRKKIFTPKSRRRAARVAKKCLIENSGEENLKETVTPEKAYNIVEINSEDAQKATKEAIQTESNLAIKGNRKRKNVLKHTGIENDSEEDAMSDKKDGENKGTNEEEIRAKRRKIKGKRSNKALRKSIEDKRSNNASSEEECQTQENDRTDIKESILTKNKHEKRNKSVKSSVKEKIAPYTKTFPEKEDEAAEVSSKKKVKAVKPQGRNSRAFLGIDLNINLIESGRSVRQSSRLAQIKIKEQVDPKVIEETHQKFEKNNRKLAKKDEHEDKLKGVSKKHRRIKADVSEEDTMEEESITERKKRKKKKKKNPVKAFNERDPWKSSSGSSSEVEEDDEEYHFDDIVEEEEDPTAIRSDHEFSPESDLEADGEVKPVRHARTAEKAPTTEDGETDEFACDKCGKKDHPEWILLCDTCDHGWHGSCLRPSLMLIPEGDWHCPSCHHAMLVKKLQDTLKIFDRDSKRRENEELRKKRLAYVGISLDNVLPNNIQDREGREKASGSECSESSQSGSDSQSEESDEPVYQLRQRRQGTNTYRFSEYDDLINSAIQDEIAGKKAGFVVVPEEVKQNPSKQEEEVAVSENKEESTTCNGLGEPKLAILTEETKERESNQQKTDKPDIVQKSENSSSEDEDNEEDEDCEEEFPHVVPKRTNILPRPGKKKHRRLNCLDDPSDDDDGSDEDFKGSSSEEEEEEEEEEDSDESGTGRRRPRRGNSHQGPVRRSSRARRSRFDKEFINDDSEESDAPRRKKTRKVWTDSESESEDSTWGRRKKKKNQVSFGRKKTKKNKKFIIEDELSETESSKVPKKKRQRKIKYGGLDELAVENLPSRRTRGKKINYQEVLGSDSDEEIKKPKNLKKAFIKEEDEFVAEEEKEDSEDSSGEDDDNEEGSDDENKNKEENKSDAKPTEGRKPKACPVPAPNSPPTQVLKDKPSNSALESSKKVKAMIAPPPERLVSEDEQYKAIVSKVSTATHSDSSVSESGIKLTRSVYISDHSNNSSDFNEHPSRHLTPIKIPPSSSIDLKFRNRSPPIKIRSGVAVNTAGRRSPVASEYSIKTIKLESPQLPQKMVRNTQPKTQQLSLTRRPVEPTIKMEKTANDDEEDYLDDIEEEEDDELENDDDSDDDLLEEGQIPKKVARRMAKMEERMLMQQEAKRLASDTLTGKNIPIAQPPATAASEHKPLLRVVSPQKLMANPSGASFMHSPPRMAMGIRPPQPPPLMSVEDGSTKRRGRGRGKKQPDKTEQSVAPGGGSVIRGILQQGQPYFPAQYPPHPRIPFRPSFHHPSPSGGGAINVKQEPTSNIPSKPSPPFHPAVPPPHRFDAAQLRPPTYPPQFGNYAPPNANYHYSNYPRDEPQGFTVQQAYNEPPPPAGTNDNDSGEFGGLVSYFSSQREEELDT